MLNIKSIDHYRDGGTIALKCCMTVRWKRVVWLEDRVGDIIEVCIDGRSGKEPKFWFGYPDSEESEIIEDQSIIDYIVDKVAEYKKLQNYRLNGFIHHKENLRDWKINNILE